MSTHRSEASLGRSPDLIVAAFDAAWRAERRPRIEESLAGIRKSEAPALFQRLLEVELCCRRGLGESFRVAEYLDRFPDFASEIHRVFGYELETFEPRGSSFVPTGTTAVATDVIRSDASVWDRPTDRAIDRPGPGRSALPDRIGRFEILSLIGRANFLVYLARDPGVGRLVAIKVARPDDEQDRRRLMLLADEADKLKALNHPGIVKLYEYVQPGEPGAGREGYIVLEYVHGCTLESMFKVGQMPCLVLLEVMAQVADAVEACHQAGFVHRDLKPSNILIDSDGNPRVADYGLAVDEEVQLLRRGELAGSLDYMAPEQARCETHRLDCRTDIWALGVILYRGLTGKLPFPGRTIHEVLDEIEHRDPRPPRMYNAAIDPEIERICLRCLAKPMSERYLTASDLALELRRVISEYPEPAAPESAASIPPRGLVPFRSEDSKVFHALLPGPRNADGIPESVCSWKFRIESIDPDSAFPVGVLFGPSGSGKSSLMLAGVLPWIDRVRVRRIFLQATPEDLVPRLRALLARQVPNLPEDAGLAEAFTLVRTGQARLTEAKLVVVIDQFEQWLQAHHDLKESELVRALRQCDGFRVQVVLIMRDDFWMPLVELFRVLELPLELDRNAIAVDLLDVPHARHVLETFRRGLGGSTDDPSRDKQFVEQVVRGLVEPNGQVLPMRISLFVEVFRNRAWTLENLRLLGGFDGIGVKFLDDRFASAPYQEYRDPARRMLEALLPAPTQAIREAPRSYSELEKQSRMHGPRGNLEDLLRVLSEELHLIVAASTEAAKDTSDADRAPISPVPEERLYQLAHDSLVRPVRQWVDREDGSTPTGRARRRLSLSAAAWQRSPETRQLPSFLEWMTIYARVPSRDWAVSETQMMRAANRRYLSLAAGAVLLLASTGWFLRSHSDKTQADILATRIVHSGMGHVGSGLTLIAPYGGHAIQALEKYEALGKDSEEHHIASVALYALAPNEERAQTILQQIRVARSPADLKSIMDAAKLRPDHLLTSLHKLSSESDKGNLQYHANVILALLELGHDQRAWDALRYTEAPDLRAHLIDQMSQYPDLLETIVARLWVASDPGEIQGLLCILSETVTRFPPSRVLPRLTRSQTARRAEAASKNRGPGVTRFATDFSRSSSRKEGRGDAPTAVELARTLFQEHDDPGVHSAADLLLRRLNHDPNTPRPDAHRPASKEGRSLRWRQGVNGHTFAIVDARRPFLMGSSQEVMAEYGVTNEARHWRRIGRWLEAGTTEVTVQQYQAFDPSYQPTPQHSKGTATSPVNSVSWFEIAAYCNWLSNLAGIPEDQWCYPTAIATVLHPADRALDEIPVDDEMEFWRRANGGGADLELAASGPVLAFDLDANAVNRRGYRLMTEAEYEFLSRVGTTTTWHFGESRELLSRYAWTSTNSFQRMSETAQLLPNQLGLFDMVGNLWELCHDGARPDDSIHPYPVPPAGGVLGDEPESMRVTEATARYARGGSYWALPYRARSAHRDHIDASSSVHFVGFRVVRTLAESAPEITTPRPPGLASQSASGP